MSGRSKHFERWVTYVRDLYQRFIIDVRHLPTDKMPADIFTKAVCVHGWQKALDMLHMCWMVLFRPFGGGRRRTRSRTWRRLASWHQSRC